MLLLVAVGTPGLAAPLPLITGAWYGVGDLSQVRGGDMAALLPTGKVLIVGGMTLPALDLASAELYDPRTGTFTPTGSLSFATEQGTATLLPSGQVLVAGGANGGTSDATSQANLYDPTTGTFTPTGSMTTVRVAQTATLLHTGKVLVTGGCNGIFFGCTITTNSAELYDPATGTFTPTGSMILPRANAAAALLANGQVLIAGGCMDGGGCDPAYTTYASAEVYTPATGTWRLVGKMTEPRYDPTATLLPNGQVLVAGGANALHGGGGIEGQPLASAELYTPRTGTFTATASMHDSRDLHTATLLPHGGVLVAGGCAFWSGSCVGEVKNTADVYWYK